MSNMCTQSGTIIQRMTELGERAGVGLRFIRELECNKPTLRLDKVDQVLKLFGHTVGPIPVKRDAG